jgi:glyoxylase-like metal-dependent hydrolase (beta-lactamase superfamily II)
MIHAPGHTPGHISYYLNRYSLLIAGDILQIVNNKLVKCPDFTVVDKSAVAASLKKLCQLYVMSTPSDVISP